MGGRVGQGWGWVRWTLGWIQKIKPKQWLTFVHHSLEIPQFAWDPEVHLLDHPLPQVFTWVLVWTVAWASVAAVKLIGKLFVSVWEANLQVITPEVPTGARMNLGDA